jgi:hypothetical protein
MEILRAFWDEPVALDPASEPTQERQLPACRPGELAALWRAQGLLDVREEPLVIPLKFSFFEDFWSPFREGQGPAGAHVASLSEDSRRDLEQRLRRRLLGEGGDRPITLKARAWAVRGLVSRDTAQLAANAGVVAAGGFMGDFQRRELERLLRWIAPCPVSRGHSIIRR